MISNYEFFSLPPPSLDRFIHLETSSLQLAIPTPFYHFGILQLAAAPLFYLRIAMRIEFSFR